MFKTYVCWLMEFLNYWVMTVLGLKLLIPHYKSEIKETVWRYRGIIAVISIPFAIIAAGNHQYVLYSNFLTYTLILYMYIVLKILSGFRARHILTMIMIYVNSMRLIDLWMAAILLEVSRISRYVHPDVLHMGRDRCIFIALLILIYFICYGLLKRNVLIEYLEDNPFYRGILGVYTFLGIICFYRVYLFDDNVRLIRYWIFYMVCAFIIGGLFLFHMVFSKEREKADRLELYNRLMLSNFRMFQKAYEEKRILYHDYKNHMLAVGQLIQEGREEEALAYIEAYIQRAAVRSQRIWSGWKILDIIVSGKMEEAEAKGIQCECAVEMIGEGGIEDMDMCALLANLFDNAIEACERVKEEGPWISFKAVRRRDMLILKIGNSIPAKEGEKKNFFQTGKAHPENHGLGMKSIENVLRKYDGMKEYQVDQRGFYCRIFIPLENFQRQKASIQRH